MKFTQFFSYWDTAFGFLREVARLEIESFVPKKHGKHIWRLPTANSRYLLPIESQPYQVHGSLVHRVFRKKIRTWIPYFGATDWPQGLEDEYELCTHLGPCSEDRDCLLAEWDEWSACSCSCYGVKERHRRITQFAKAGMYVRWFSVSPDNLGKMSNLTIYLIQCFLGWDHSPESNYSPSLQSWKWSIFVQSSFKMSTKILSWVFGKGSFSTSMFVAGRDQKLAEQKLWGHKNHVGVLDSWHFLGGNPKTKTICDLVYRFSVLYHGISLNPCICKLGPQNAGRVGWILEGAFPHQWPRGSPMPYWVKFCLSNNNRFAAGQWEILRCSGCPTWQVRRIRSTQLWWNVPQLMWNTSKR